MACDFTTAPSLVFASADATGVSVAASDVVVMLFLLLLLLSPCCRYCHCVSNQVAVAVLLLIIESGAVSEETFDTFVRALFALIT